MWGPELHHVHGEIDLRAQCRYQKVPAKLEQFQIAFLLSTQGKTTNRLHTGKGFFMAGVWNQKAFPLSSEHVS